MLHSGQVSSQYLRFQDCYFQEPASSYSLCRGPWTFNSGIRILLRGIAASTCGDAEVLLPLTMKDYNLQFLTICLKQHLSFIRNSNSFTLLTLFYYFRDMAMDNVFYSLLMVVLHLYQSSSQLVSIRIIIFY